MSTEQDEVILILSGDPLICKKTELSSNSDYFKAMFEGHFIEKGKRTVTIEGVPFRSMSIILRLLWDEGFIVEYDDLFSVLQTSAMLQFNNIKNMCIERVTELLSPQNCLQTWIITERLSIKPLYMKAKLLAFNEFIEIKDSNYLCELTFEEIYNYLGNVYLKTIGELFVFQTAMRWWYENSALHSSSDKPEDKLLHLLSCVNFKHMLIDEMREIILYEDIKENNFLKEIFQCITDARSGKKMEFSEQTQKLADWLLSSRDRISASVPCILTNRSIINEPTEIKKDVIFYDSFRRKISYGALENNKCDKYSMIMYDRITNSFKKFFDIGENKLEDLEGYKLIGYKEFVFLFGGEQRLGKGRWNRNFWVYDTIREKWERKSVLKEARRHFESCVVGNKVYIVGGTGVYRVIQENLLWYDYKEDIWSKTIPIPCSRMKCCCYCEKLFLFRIDVKSGYFFENDIWTEVKMDMADEVIHKQSEFVMFSYKEQLFIKGKNLVELSLNNLKFTVASVQTMTDIDYQSVEVAVCNETVYTLYKYVQDKYDVFALEMYNIADKKCEFLFRDAKYPNHVDVNGEIHQISPLVRIIPFEHYFLVEDNVLINNIFQC